MKLLKRFWNWIRGRRTLKAEWTVEPKEDLEIQYGLNAVDEIVQSVTEEMKK